MATAEIAQGHPQAALAGLEESRERVLASGAGTAVPSIETTLASCHAALGNLDAANRHLEELIETGADFGIFLAGALATLADVRRAQGDSASAAAHAERALATSERVGNPWISASAREVLARLAAARGSWTEAEELLQDALAQRAQAQVCLHLPQTLDALAEVAAGLESYEEAARLLGAAERSRADLGLVRWPPDQPRMRALTEALRAELGDEAFGAAHAEGAALTLEEAIAWIRRARGSRKRPAGGWASLTPTEVEVVKLAAQGLTNPQIGERMFVSRATVKVHLAHIFQKLDVHTRAELTAQAIRREN